MSVRFRARWDGDCEVCGKSVFEDDEVGYTKDDEFACSDCLDEDDRGELPDMDYL